jgi:hypothetical protein
MSEGSTAGRLLAGLTAMALLAGCATGASPTPRPTSPTLASVPSTAAATPTPTATASTAAAPSSTPAPVSFGPVTVVSGTSDCADPNPTWTTDQDGTLHARNQPVECTDKTNDPRVNGSHIANWNMDVWGDITQSTAAGVQWGTVRIENTGGTWEGRFSGVASLPQPGDTIAEWYRGTGDYEGLTYFESVTGVCCTYVIRGQIFPGDPPTP